MYLNPPEKLTPKPVSHNFVGRPRRELPFEIVSLEEFNKRFPNKRNVLVVRSASYGLVQKKQGNQLFLICEPLPFVFEMSEAELEGFYVLSDLGRILGSLSQLRRIRIIQSVKNKDLIFYTLSSKQGEFVEKGELEVTFSHTLIAQDSRTAKFIAQFKKLDEEVFSIIHLDRAEQNKLPTGTNFEFPNNCCVLTLKLYRKGMTRSFTCLVWFMEKRFKNNKVYFCAVKIDLQTKVNLFFTPKKLEHGELNLILSKIEISIRNQSPMTRHTDKYEFYSSIKKSNLDQDIANYKFNINPEYVSRAAERIFGLRQNGPRETLLNEKSYELSPTSGSTRQTTLMMINKSTCRQTYISKTLQSAISEEHNSNTILKLIADKDRCMDLQQSLLTLIALGDQEIIGKMFKKILPVAVAASTCVFGNFLVQLLIPNLTDIQRIELIYAYLPEFQALCSNPKGTFCIQKLIEICKNELEMDLIIGNLIQNMNTLIKNVHAGFVFKKVLQTLPYHHSLKLLKGVLGNLLEYASDKHGVCVVNLFLEKYSSDKTIVEKIAQEFNSVRKIGKLNSHFNYGVQHLIEVYIKNRWPLLDVEQIILAYLQPDMEFRFHSKSVRQILELVEKYHKKNSLDANLAANSIEDSFSQLIGSQGQ